MNDTLHMKWMLKVTTSKKGTNLHTLSYIIPRCDSISHESAGGHGESTWHTDRLSLICELQTPPLISILFSSFLLPLITSVTQPLYPPHIPTPSCDIKFCYLPYLSQNKATEEVPGVWSCVCNTTADTDGNTERTAGETSLSLLWFYCYFYLYICWYI